MSRPIVTRRTPTPLDWAFVAGTLVAAAILWSLWAWEAPKPEGPDVGAALSDMGARAAVVALGPPAYARAAAEVEPLVRALAVRARDTAYARVIAWELWRAAEAEHLDPRLLVGVVRVENPWLVPDTASYAGATGVMQVMPFHAGEWGCEDDDLTDPAVNVCHGTRILRRYLRRSLRGAVREALLAYNGCVRTPGCEVYDDHVRRLTPTEDP